jgi:hypothetical protein
MFALEHEALVAEAELRQAFLQSMVPAAGQFGIDLKTATAQRAAAFEKVAVSLDPFPAGPGGGKK